MGSTQASIQASTQASTEDVTMFELEPKVLLSQRHGASAYEQSGSSVHEIGANHHHELPCTSFSTRERETRPLAIEESNRRSSLGYFRSPPALSESFHGTGGNFHDRKTISSLPESQRPNILQNSQLGGTNSLPTRGQSHRSPEMFQLSNSSMLYHSKLFQTSSESNYPTLPTSMQGAALSPEVSASSESQALPEYIEDTTSAPTYAFKHNLAIVVPPVSSSQPISSVGASISTYLVQALQDVYTDLHRRIQRKVSKAVLMHLSLLDNPAKLICKGLDTIRSQSSGEYLMTPEDVGAFQLICHSMAFVIHGKDYNKYTEKIKLECISFLSTLEISKKKAALEKFLQALFSLCQPPESQGGEIDPDGWLQFLREDKGMDQPYISQFPWSINLPFSERLYSLLNTGTLEYQGCRAHPSLELFISQASDGLSSFPDTLALRICIRYLHVLGYARIFWVDNSNGLSTPSPDSPLCELPCFIHNDILGPLSIAREFSELKSHFENLYEDLNCGALISQRKVELSLLEIAKNHWGMSRPKFWEFVSVLIELLQAANMQAYVAPGSALNFVGPCRATVDWLTNELRLPQCVTPDSASMSTTTPFQMGPTSPLSPTSLISSNSPSHNSPSTSQPVKCPDCPTTFTGKSAVGNCNRHWSSKHQQDLQDQALHCRRCNQRFARTDIARKHETTVACKPTSKYLVSPPYVG